MTGKWKRDDEEVQFLPESESYCISYIDVVNSTENTAALSEEQVRMYYSLFLNSIGTVAKSYGAKIIKTLGDGMLFYMPSTRNCGDEAAFDQALSCCFALLVERHIINKITNSEGIRPMGFRISIDYGQVQIAKTPASDDLFGSTVNICTKINRLARPNGIVIGSDLYRIIGKHNRYHFEEASSYKVDKKFEYPVYHVNLRHQNSPAPVYREVPMNIDVDPHQRKIMIVDDEEDILVTFKMILTNAGYDVDSFSDSEIALADFAKSRPDPYALVILDVRMPKLNGLQLFQRIKAINSRTKIMFVTALDAIDELKSILPMPCEAALKKPVQKDQLVTKVHTLINEQVRHTSGNARIHYTA